MVLSIPLPRTARSLGHAMRVAVDALVELLTRAWSAHCRLLRENPAYATAAAAGLAAVVGQDSLLDLIAAILAALVGIYAATRGRGRGGITRWEDFA